MSIVAVKVTDACIELASDSIQVRGYTQSKSINKYSKMVKINDMFIGSVGTAEESSLLWVFTNTRRPEQATESALLTFLSEFADWKNSKIGKASIENEYIFVIGTKVFQVENFFIPDVPAVRYFFQFFPRSAVFLPGFSEPGSLDKTYMGLPQPIFRSFGFCPQGFGFRTYKYIRPELFQFLSVPAIQQLVIRPGHRT